MQLTDLSSATKPNFKALIVNSFRIQNRVFKAIETISCRLFVIVNPLSYIYFLTRQTSLMMIFFHS